MDGDFDAKTPASKIEKLAVSALADYSMGFSGYATRDAQQLADTVASIWGDPAKAIAISAQVEHDMSKPTGFMPIMVGAQGKVGLDNSGKTSMDFNITPFGNRDTTMNLKVENNLVSLTMHDTNASKNPHELITVEAPIKSKS